MQPNPMNTVDMRGVTPAGGITGTYAPKALLDEIVDRTSDRFRLGFEPGLASDKSLDDAWAIAERVTAAGMTPSAEDAYTRILIGRALGLPAMASVQGIVLIPTKSEGSVRMVPCMYVRTKLALLQARKDVVEYVRPKSLSNISATWVGKRRGEEEIEYTFTIEDARIAGFIDRGESKNREGVSMNNWNRHPGAMLQWRALGRLCDIIGADILNGVASREDLEDEAKLDAIRAATNEFLESKGVRSLEDKLAAREVPASPVRDWAAEAEALKKALAAAIESKDKAAQRSAKEAFERFKAEAPAFSVEDVVTFYNLARGKNSKGKPAQPDEPTLEAKASAPATPPGDKEGAKPEAKPAPTGRWLPPSQRGDAYEGPFTDSDPDPLGG